MNVIPPDRRPSRRPAFRGHHLSPDQEGKFPTPRKVGKKSVWEEEAIDRWIMDLPSGVSGVPQLRRGR